METERARHETEESLILAQFGTSHNISEKLQNGDESTKGDSQAIEDTNWNHYKASTGANSMKRQRESCNSPRSVQGLFDQGSYLMNGELMNGELKHPLNDQALIVHQTKKLKANPDFKGNDDISSSLEDNFPELTETTDFECNTSQTEITLEKRNCNFPNGDIFGLPRNKNVPISNGSATPSANTDNCPGDLLQKTLSHYYPEQVSIAQQTTEPELDAVNGSFANKSDEGVQPFSGMCNSAQHPNSQQQQPGVAVSVEGSNDYNSVNYVGNGFSKNFGADQHQQQQQQQYPQRQPFHSGRELHLGQQSEASSKIGNLAEQNQNSQQCYPKSTNCQGAFVKDNQEMNPIQQNTTLKASDIAGCGSFPNSLLQSQNKGPRSGQHHDIDSGHPCVVQQLCHVESGVPSQAHEQDMWVGFPARSQQDQPPTNPMVHQQMPDSNQVNRFQSQDLNSGNFIDNGPGPNSFQQQQQESIQAKTRCAQNQHNTNTEWQQPNSKAPEMHPSLPQKVSKQCNFTPTHQAERNLSMQSEHLCEDPDLQDILSPGFSASQQQHCNLQRPLSHPPQLDEQQIKSPNYRPRSQPQPIQQQPKPNQLLMNNSTLSNNQHIDYNKTTENQQYHRQYPPNFTTNNPKHFQQHPSNNHCQQPNHEDISQSHLLQRKLSEPSSTHIYPKDEMKVSCAQLQRGAGMPLKPLGAQGEIQRHEALRTHLLQKQERQGLPRVSQRIGDVTQGLGTMASQQQAPPLPMQDSGMGRVKIKQENQQSLCDQNRRPGNILASMEESLRQYQLSPVFEKKSMVINSLNKVKVESSGAVTILSTNNESSIMEPYAASANNVALKRPPDLTPKKENLLQSFIESPMKLLDTPIKNLLETPMKTQYEIASCHCVGKSRDIRELFFTLYSVKYNHFSFILFRTNQ